MVEDIIYNLKGESKKLWAVDYTLSWQKLLSTSHILFLPISPNLDRSGPPYVVQVDCSIPRMVVMGRIRIGISEPCLVELFPRGGLGFFQAGDESALGALGVMSKAGFQGSDRLEEEFFLLVENPREVR